MTGLKPDTDVIIEMATIVTDPDLNTVAEGPVIAIHQPPEVLDAMDEWNKRTHGASGLIERVRSSTYTMASAEKRTLESLTLLVEPGSSPMCGNSICQDRRFLARHMPTLEKFFHYRNLDVSTLKELARRWAPGLIPGFSKQRRTHGARRHPGIDSRARVLPRTFSRAGIRQAVTFPSSPTSSRRPGVSAPFVVRTPVMRSAAFDARVGCAGVLQVRKPADRRRVQISRRHECVAAARCETHAARDHALLRQSWQCACAGRAGARHAGHCRHPSGFRALEDRGHRGRGRARGVV